MCRKFLRNILRERGGGRITDEERLRCVAGADAVVGIRADPQAQVSGPLQKQRRTGAARRKKRRGKGQETTVASSGVGCEPTSPASLATELEENVLTVTDEEGGCGNMTSPPTLSPPPRGGAGAVGPGQGDTTGRVVTLRTPRTPCRLSLGKAARLREARTKTGQQ